MWQFFLLAILALSDGYAIPPGIKKVANNIILNGTTYNSFVTVPTTGYLIEFQQSTDLITWTNRTCVMDVFSAPLWASNRVYTDHDINVIDTNSVRLYFSASDLNAANNLSITVALAERLNINPRMYTVISRPLLPSKGIGNLTSPSLLYLTNGKLVLTYFDVGSYLTHGVPLSPDGLEVEDIPKPLFQVDRVSEKGFRHQWGFQKNGFTYIFYEIDDGVLGVARSVDPLGSYEKIAAPIFLKAKSKLHREDLKEALEFGEDGWPFIRE